MGGMGIYLIYSKVSNEFERNHSTWIHLRVGRGFVPRARRGFVPRVQESRIWCVLHVGAAPRVYSRRVGCAGDNSFLSMAVDMARLRAGLPTMTPKLLSVTVQDDGEAETKPDA